MSLTNQSVQSGPLEARDKGAYNRFFPCMGSPTYAIKTQRKALGALLSNMIISYLEWPSLVERCTLSLRDSWGLGASLHSPDEAVAGELQTGVGEDSLRPGE